MSQLSQIFTNIANAIRSKTGSNELITPPQMATAIDNIPSGGGELVYDNTIRGNTILSSGTKIKISLNGGFNGLVDRTADGTSTLSEIVDNACIYGYMQGYVGTLGDTIIASGYHALNPPED